MKKAVWKYPLRVGDWSPQGHIMPDTAQILSAQMQGSDIMLWALVEPWRTSNETRNFMVVGTGQEFELPSWSRFIATVQMFGGGLVWHIFEVGREL